MIDSVHPLRRWRNERGLTLEKAGALIGASKSMLSAYESGRKIPHRDVMVKIRRVSGGAVTPNDFYPAEAAE